MKLDQFATMRGYQLSHNSTGSQFVDHFLNGEKGDEIRAELKLKRIQFDTAAELTERLESVCSLLDCSKREFLEMAVWEAIERAQGVFEDAFKEASGRDIADEFGVKQGA